MTEAEARGWIRDRFGVSRETTLAEFVAQLLAETEHQNLISRATIESVWQRHIVDSAQLLGLLPADAPVGRWVDIGTGAGFPGMVIALLSEREVALVEPRRRRADFLAAAVRQLGLEARVTVHPCRVERVTGSAAIISARAVAPLAELFAAARHLCRPETLWLLPKGINAREEVAAARQRWHGVFHVEPSLTQAGSAIIVATGVTRQ